MNKGMISSSNRTVVAGNLPTFERDIIYRTQGRRHGPITRLVSPSDLGELIKPFVFLDYFESVPNSPADFGWHPHSGIATVTIILSGSFTYEDSTGKQGILSQGAVEWMKAGGGVWHTGKAAGNDIIRGFQLWLALTEEHELTPAESIYLASEDIKRDGPVKVILGKYGAAKSPIPSPSSLNYLFVQLKDGQHWRFTPEADHAVCWIAMQTGELEAGVRIEKRELVVFKPSDEPIDFRAKGDAAFVLGSAIKHPHDLVLGNYSVHSSRDSLIKGEDGIRRIANQLQAKGKLSALMWR